MFSILACFKVDMLKRFKSFIIYRWKGEIEDPSGRFRDEKNLLEPSRSFHVYLHFSSEIIKLLTNFSTTLLLQPFSTLSKCPISN